MNAPTIDVTENRQPVADFIRALGTIRHPIKLVFAGRTIGRLVPKGELSQSEKKRIVAAGWKAVQRARRRNRGISERELAQTVNAAVQRARAKR